MKWSGLRQHLMNNYPDYQRHDYSNNIVRTSDATIANNDIAHLLIKIFQDTVPEFPRKVRLYSQVYNVSTTSFDTYINDVMRMLQPAEVNQNCTIQFYKTSRGYSVINRLDTTEQLKRDTYLETILQTEVNHKIRVYMLKNSTANSMVIVSNKQLDWETGFLYFILMRQIYHTGKTIAQNLTDLLIKISPEQTHLAGYATDFTQVFMRDIIKYNKINDEQIKQSLTHFISHFSQEQQNKLEASINDYNRYIKQNLQQYEEYLQKIESLTQQLTGLRLDKTDTNIDTVLKYLEKVKDSVQLRHAGTNTIDIIITTPLTNWDKSFAEKLIERTAFWDAYPETTKMMFKKIFIDETVSIKLHSVLRIKSTSTDVVSKDYGPTGTLMNPHLNHFHCLGNYQRPIVEAKRKGDIVSVIELFRASVQNISLSDSTVLAYFLRHDFNDVNSEKFWVDNDTCLSITKIKEREENTTNEKN